MTKKIKTTIVNLTIATTVSLQNSFSLLNLLTRLMDKFNNGLGILNAINIYDLDERLIKCRI